MDLSRHFLAWVVGQIRTLEGKSGGPEGTLLVVPSRPSPLHARTQACLPGSSETTHESAGVRQEGLHCSAQPAEEAGGPDLPPFPGAGRV